MNRGGFSLSRLLGVSAAKARASRAVGIPLTRSGREAKLGRMVLRGSGCLLPLLGLSSLPLLTFAAALLW